MTFQDLNNIQKSLTDNSMTDLKSARLGKTDSRNVGLLYPGQENEMMTKKVLSLNISSKSGCFVIDNGEEHEFLMSLINTIPFGMHIVDMEGNILYQSEKMKEMAGGDCTGKKCWEICSDRKVQNDDCPLLCKSNSGETVLYEARDMFGGRIFSISHSKMSFRGKPAMLEIFQDITARKVAEDGLRRSESHYRSLVELSPDAVAIVDFEGFVRYASQKVYPLLMIPQGYNLTGASILDWVSPDYHLKAMERIHALLTGDNRPETNEYRLLRYDGSPFWAEVSSSVLPSSNEVDGGLLVICRDITERKKAASESLFAKEKAEEADRLKSAFLKNISHEIRTPLNAIVGFSTLLNDEVIDRETMKSYTGIIIRSANNLVSVVENIIEMANIEAGVIKSRLIPCDINGIIEKLYSESRFKFHARGLNFTFTPLLPAGRSMVMTDVAKVEFILSAFLSNALKFTEKGRVCIECLYTGSTIELIVTDTGTGIKPGDEVRIFEKFYQADSSLSRMKEGTGLGLPISKAYAEIINGSVGVKSEYGKGSSFCLTIPYIPIVSKNMAFTGKAI